MFRSEISVEIIPFSKKYARSVRSVALKSWKYTYKNIYTPEEINRYIETNYVPKHLALLESFVKDGIISFNLAKVRGKIVGFCHIGKKDEVVLFRIYLLPEWMGKGIGRMLLDEGEKWVTETKAKEYATTVQKKNTTGIRFYEKNGFIRDDSLDKDDEVGYRKTL